MTVSTSTTGLSSTAGAVDATFVLDVEVAEVFRVLEDPVLEVPVRVDPVRVDAELFTPELFDPELFDPERFAPELFAPEFVEVGVVASELADPALVEPELDDPAAFAVALFDLVPVEPALLPAVLFPEVLFPVAAFPEVLMPAVSADVVPFEPAFFDELREVEERPVRLEVPADELDEEPLVVSCAVSAATSGVPDRVVAPVRRLEAAAVRPRRSAAARAMPTARSRFPLRSRRADSSETDSPEKNMSTGRVAEGPRSVSESGRVRVRSSCSGAGVAPAPGIRAPSPRPSPRFCVMAVVLPRNVVAVVNSAPAARGVAPWSGGAWSGS
ncbi:hypothetical protein [Brachybacterium saurashtrense]|uniref:hypothetical protein n=1 Tax=Brachybacterium saurashtrense TaxID=556288 RepID=UPI001F498C42|nr:hypothetical protein [Brachybacterium saurashtrense]